MITPMSLYKRLRLSHLYGTLVVAIALGLVVMVLVNKPTPSYIIKEPAPPVELETRITELEEAQPPLTEETEELMEQLHELENKLIELKERLIELRKMQILKLEGKLHEA